MMTQQSQQPGPLPTTIESSGLVVTSNVQKLAVKKKILTPEDNELFELTQAAGITMDQEVFKIMVDLLKMNVAPQAVFQTLKAMCAGQRIAETCVGESSVASNTTGTNTAPAEQREEDTAVTSKSAKASLPPYSTSRAARVKTKAMEYSSQDGSSSHTQGRGKVGPKVQRYFSATRGQKTKSSGNSSSSSQTHPPNLG